MYKFTYEILTTNEILTTYEIITTYEILTTIKKLQSWAYKICTDQMSLSCAVQFRSPHTPSPLPNSLLFGICDCQHWTGVRGLRTHKQQHTF